MSRKMAAIILLYGLTVTTLAFVLRSVAPDRNAVFFIALVAGVLSLACGVAVWMGRKRRAWIVLTSTAFTFFMLAQVVGEWTSTLAEGVPASRIVMTLMLLLTFGMLLYSVHVERPPGFYEPRAAGS